MKKNNLKTKFKNFLPFGNSAGFTLIEVLASMVILSVGILGLASAVNSVNHYQNQSKNVTLATMHTTSKLEEIKRRGTNEPTGGIYGFDYLVDDGANGYMNGYAAPDAWTRSSSDTVNGFTRNWELTIYPTTAQATESFTNPGTIHMVDVAVTTSWVDGKGKTKSVQAGTVMHRRQFIN